MIKYLILICCLLFMTASVYSQAKRKSLSTRAVSAVTMQQGEIIYKKVCVACHMANGGGVPNMNPPLINTNYVLGDKSALIKIVLNGFKDDVQINGKSYSNVMTPHRELKDTEIASVLTYVRNSFGNKASGVNPSLVKTVRAGTKI